MTSRIVLLAAGFVSSLASVGAAADDLLSYTRPTAVEITALPPYCAYTQDFNVRLPGGGDNPGVKSWYERMGPIFHAMHHYCWGLNAYSRSQRAGASPQIRRRLLASSVNEYDYVIERAPKDFVLLPELRTKKAQSLVRLGRNPEAVREFEEAIQLKPDYWPPYAYLSDLYAELGDIANARQVLEAGLKNAPDAQALLRRRAALDQKWSGKPGAK